MTRKPKTIEGWEKVCNNLNAALHALLDSEAELLVKVETLEKKIEDLNTTLIKSAGIINYLEMKLERSNSV